MSTKWHCAALMAILVLAFALPEHAHAQAAGFDKFATYLGSIVSMLKGTLGKSIAALAVAGLFLAGMFGQMEPKRALVIGFCIVGFFAVTSIVDSLAGA